MYTGLDIVDPALQAAQHRLERSKTSDFLAHFLRKRREKEHKLSPPIRISKTELTFGDKPCDVNDTVFDEIDIKNKEFSRIKWRIECNVYNQPFILSFEPPTGRLSAVRHKTWH